MDKVLVQLNAAVSYCSKDCQQFDWKDGHNLECARLAEAVKNRPVVPLKPIPQITHSELQKLLAWRPPPGIRCGLENVGNTCFANAVLQSLTYTPPLTYYLLSKHHSKNCQLRTFCLLCAMERHVAQCTFRRTGDRALVPHEILKNIKHIHSDIQIGLQMDAHEFARMTIEVMHKSCLQGYPEFPGEKIEELSSIHRLFGGTLSDVRRCLECGHSHRRDELFLDVCLGIDNARTLEDAFKQFTTMEKIDDFNCEDGCGKKVTIEKGYRIKKTPHVLMVGLKRFAMTESLFGGKNNDPVSYRKVLDLEPFMVDNYRKFSRRIMEQQDARELEAAVSREAERQAKEASIKAKKERKNKGGKKRKRGFKVDASASSRGSSNPSSGGQTPTSTLKDINLTKYKLYAVVVHIGRGSYFGHYTAYIKDVQGDWYCCDDETVTKEVQRQNAYLLMYVRMSDAEAEEYVEEAEDEALVSAVRYGSEPGSVLDDIDQVCNSYSDLAIVPIGEPEDSRVFSSAPAVTTSGNATDNGGTAGRATSPCPTSEANAFTGADTAPVQDSVCPVTDGDGDRAQIEPSDALPRAHDSAAEPSEDAAADGSPSLVKTSPEGIKTAEADRVSTAGATVDETALV